MPSFTYPLAFAGLVGIAVITAIYMFRSKSQLTYVSTLMFWSFMKKPSEGGLMYQGLQSPLIMLLEILAVLLLTFAAAEPRITLGQARIPLVVILDDSFSMKAGNALSAREKAVTWIIREMNREPRYQTRFITAGNRPEFLCGLVQSAKDADEMLKLWKCGSINADMGKALLLATESSFMNPRIVILSDRTPDIDLEGGRIRWISFGENRANLAVTHASRVSYGDTDRIMIEVSNFSENEVSVEGRFVINEIDKSEQITRIELEAGSFRKFVAEFPKSAETISFKIPDDALEVDNQATLVRTQQEPVSVAIRITSPELSRIVQNSVESVEHSKLADDNPDLLITDNEASLHEGNYDHNPDRWILAFVRSERQVTYTGPFAANKNHPLLNGVSVEGIRWTADPELTLNGRPMIMAGNRTLLSDDRNITSNRIFRFNFSTIGSNLQYSPTWPIIFWNLLHARRLINPGPTEPNLKLGMQAQIYANRGYEKLDVSSPSESAKSVDVYNRKAVITIDEPGLWKVNSGNARWMIAANALSADESDLSDCETGEWGDWTASPAFVSETTDLSWSFMIAGICVFMIHLFMTAGKSGGNRI